MTKLPILVRNISNLTDARYFAALHPDFMALAIDDDCERFNQLFAALEPWIEGPHWLLDLPLKLPENYLESVLQEHEKLVGVIGKAAQLSALANINCTKFLESDAKGYEMGSITGQILTIEEMQSPSKTSHKYDIYVKLEELRDWELVQQRQLAPKGVVLQGSGEEKVGWKSFDALDQLVDALI